MPNKKRIIMKTVFICSAVITAACLYLLYKKGNSVKRTNLLDLSNVKIETIDGILRLDDIVHIFKSFNLNQETDTPFIADKNKLEKLFEVYPFNILKKEDYTSVVIGVYKQEPKKKETVMLEIIYAKTLDKELEDVLSQAKDDNPLVVLN